jgi:hypothetical protein
VSANKRQDIAASANPAAPSKLTAAEARELLCEICNLRTEDQKALNRFYKRHGSWLRIFEHSTFRDKGASISADGTSPLAMHAFFMDLSNGREHFGPILAFGHYLRQVWALPTEAERQKGVMGISLELGRLHTLRSGEAFSLMHSPLVSVLLEAVHAADMMRVCQNPSCPARYFLAQRSTQRFCSDGCSLPAQRQYKRNWWKGRGSAWRKEHKKKKVRSNRKPGNPRRRR